MFKKKDYKKIAELIEKNVYSEVKILNEVSKRNTEVAKNYLRDKLNKERNQYYEYVKKELKL